MRSVGGNVRGKVRAPGIDMGNAKVPATAPMAAGIKDGDPHHDHVRSRLSLIEINRVKRHGAPMPIYRHPTFTVARMPQGKAKSSFPHEP
jgi:hypothetical protein